MIDNTKQYLTEMSADSKRRGVERFSSEAGEFSILLGKMTQTLQTFHRQAGDSASPAKRVAFGLMTKAANTLMAGFELALTGYRWEPSTLYRTALEGCAVGWDVVHNADRFDQWKADESKKFDSTHSISRVKEVSSIFGPMYGLLSKMNVHTPPINSSPNMFPGVDGGSPTFQLYGFTPPGKESARSGEIYISLFVAFICLQLTELIFHQYAADLETLDPIPGQLLMKARVSDRHRAFVDEMTRAFQKMVEGDL